MKTRSQTKKCSLPYYYVLKPDTTKDQPTPYSPLIDFDDASIEWNKNKKKIGNGMYAYKKVNNKKSHYKI